MVGLNPIGLYIDEYLLFIDSFYESYLSNVGLNWLGLTQLRKTDLYGDECLLFINSSQEFYPSDV